VRLVMLRSSWGWTSVSRGEQIMMRKKKGGLHARRASSTVEALQGRGIIKYRRR